MHAVADPTTAAGILGIKYATVLGGFLGAIVSLSFVTELGWAARVSAVVTGTATAAYATPVIVTYWAIGPAAENGIGFLLGLTSMNLVPALLTAAAWLRSNVGKLLDRKFNPDDKEGK